MAARVMRDEGATVLPFDRRRRSRPEAGGRRVVAVVLDDGTIQELGGDGRPDGQPFQSGQLSSDRWILWWERRSFE